MPWFVRDSALVCALLGLFHGKRRFPRFTEHLVHGFLVSVTSVSRDVDVTRWAVRVEAHPRLPERRAAVLTLLCAPWCIFVKRECAEE